MIKCFKIPNGFPGGPMPTIMKISSQGQISIPKKFMKMCGIDTGDYLEVDAEKDQIKTLIEEFIILTNNRVGKYSLPAIEYEGIEKIIGKERRSI